MQNSLTNHQVVVKLSLSFFKAEAAHFFFHFLFVLNGLILGKKISFYFEDGPSPFPNGVAPL